MHPPSLPQTKRERERERGKKKATKDAEDAHARGVGVLLRTDTVQNVTTTILFARSQS